MVGLNLESKHLVAKALELYPCSLHHSIQLEPMQAVEYCRRLDLSSEGCGMLPLLEKVNELIPKHGKYSSHIFRVGREHSPVLYLLIAKSQTPDCDWEHLALQLNAIALDCECDEYEVVKNTDLRFEYRFWWD